MGTVVVKAQNLFDGLGGTLADPVVVIKDSRIDDVYQGQAPGHVTQASLPANHSGDSPPSHNTTREDVVTFGFPGATILPGLINCHNHLNLPGDGTPFERVVHESDNVLGMLAARNAGMALHSGVTTLRDCGARGTTTFDLKRAIQAGWVEGPHLVLCGQPITITGGHCWYFGGDTTGA